MDDESPGILARLEQARVHAHQALALVHAMRRIHVRWQWVNHGFMLLDVVLIVWNVSTIGTASAPFLTWISGGVTAFLFWSFCNTWAVTQRRWEQYLAEVTWTEESVRSIDAAIEKVKGMHAHQN